ncbi:hypothetical protein Nepgr_005916 [Nepenthes gracilis]|uniref:Amine oxidase domain-containing protein n=1 Tax=Nepenthes gracilis TaxID=150966 RepID=A0AAD3XGW3_NEPGR|nr:hypothetical protein Nepgr_005916 [Nepenthes gracilis]
MVAKRSKVVIIGAGMAGLTAAHKLYSTPGSEQLFELSVVEGGTRIGGRINTREFGGDRVEMGATWIHGIGGSPIHKIAQEIKSLESQQPWECMDGFSDERMIMAETIAEGGFALKPSIVEPISSLFDKLMKMAQGKSVIDGLQNGGASSGKAGSWKLSIGSFLRQGLELYWDTEKEQEEWKGFGNWNKKSLEEAIFSMHENTQRTYTGAGDLFNLDYAAESEYRMFPGEEITIPRGYITIIESLASVLPAGLIQLGRRVIKIEWNPNLHQRASFENDQNLSPVKLQFSDGSIMRADHVIVTVSLGVLKAGIRQDSSMFIPPLPSSKTDAISRLGFGVVNKLFLRLSPKSTQQGNDDLSKFPFFQMVFHSPDYEFSRQVPKWMRRTASLHPIYSNSSVLLSWFAGDEALELESLTDEEITNGVSTTISSFLWNSPHQKQRNSHSQELCNGNAESKECSTSSDVKFTEVLKSKWGSDPLFLGSYSYVAVGSSGDDLDTMAEPLPNYESSTVAPLQILFAGEATHRTQYSTTHGAYFSGLREANRLLQHYQCLGVAQLDK